MKWGTVVDVIVFGMIERVYSEVLLRLDSVTEDRKGLYILDVL